MTESAPSVLIVAAEASSSIYAQRLLELWSANDQKVNAFGIGSESMKQVVDHILVLFPFEEEFYKKNAMKVSFVGHPLLDELHRETFDDAVRKERRQRYGVAESEFVIGLMPGSRRSEIKHHLQVQL